MIPYLHEKIQEIGWSRFLENLLTNSLTHSLTDWLHINYYNAKLIGPCPLRTGVQYGITWLIFTLLVKTRKHFQDIRFLEM